MKELEFEPRRDWLQVHLLTRPNEVQLTLEQRGVRDADLSV